MRASTVSAGRRNAMRTMAVPPLIVFYEAADADSAGLIADACRTTLDLLRRGFGLEPPADCRVYVMTSWLQFMFRAPPGLWKALLLVAAPLWMFRVIGMWKYIGGWEQRFGRRYAVGVKPPRLLAVSDRSIGGRLFLPEEDFREKARHVACHELTHAVIDRLGLPTWLMEGLPMLLTDRLAGKPTVRPDTLRGLEVAGGGGEGRGRERIRLSGTDAALRIYARGYWRTRFLEETRPGLLAELMHRGLSGPEFERGIAAAFHREPEAFWRDIDRKVAARYGGSGPSGFRSDAEQPVLRGERRT
jgi:hypothetical protein